VNHLRYFNHASFASLRRQLNYFNFTRVGKGRQRGATYCNEAVIELSDILRLKRKSVVHGPVGRNPRESCGNHVGKVAFEDMNYTSAVVPVVHIAPSREDHGHFKTISKKRKLNTNVPRTPSFPHFSPIPHAVSDDDNPVAGAVVSVDLTARTSSVQVLKSSMPTFVTVQRQSTELCGDEDILAGCSVLLSFCKAESLQHT